jgi:choline dehydrogenase-like flavoprotein
MGREPLAHFHGYTSIWQEEYFVPSESDFQAVEHIVRDWSESKHFASRGSSSHFLLVFLYWYWLSKNREEMAAYYREAIKLADKTLNKERKRKVLTTKVTPDGNRITGLEFKLVGDVIDDIKMRAHDNLELYCLITIVP